VTRWGKVVPGRKLGPRGTDRGWFYGEALTQQRGDDEELRGRGELNNDADRRSPMAKV
jgi:hypothetical protein